MAAMLRTRFHARLIVLILGLVLPAGAHPRESRQTAVQAGTQKESNAYERLRSEVDPAAKMKLIDGFAADFPESELLAYVYQEGVTLGRRANSVEIMADYGAKSLALWPDNYALRTELGSVYVQRDRVDEAETQAARALELLAIAEKPETIGEVQWETTRRTLLASNHQTLGFVHLRRAQAGQDASLRKAEAEAAIRSFRLSLEFRPIDDFTYYGLGFACGILNNYADAEASLARSVAINGVVVSGARMLLEEIYRSRHNQSLSGLSRVIAAAKAEFGIR